MPKYLDGEEPSGEEVYSAHNSRHTVYYLREVKAGTSNHHIMSKVKSRERKKFVHLCFLAYAQLAFFTLLQFWAPCLRNGATRVGCVFPHQLT